MRIHSIFAGTIFLAAQLLTLNNSAFAGDDAFTNAIESHARKVQILATYLANANADEYKQKYKEVSSEEEKLLAEFNNHDIQLPTESLTMLEQSVTAMDFISLANN